MAAEAAREKVGIGQRQFESSHNGKVAVRQSPFAYLRACFRFSKFVHVGHELAGGPVLTIGRKGNYLGCEKAQDGPSALAQRLARPWP